MKILYEQIADARKRAKITQTVLADKVHIAQGDISGIERGQVDPRLSTLMRVAMALDLDLIAVPRSHKNAVMNLIRDENEPVKDITLLDKYGVADDEG